MIVDVVIPALDEEEALPKVLAAIPSDLVRRVVVADNGSTDRTAEVARTAGALVVHEAERGYGAACMKALSWLRTDPPEIVVFLDGDYSDDPADLPTLLAPLQQNVDLVIGSRVRGALEAGALTPVQRFGNTVACLGLRLLYGARYTDLGPFRAIRWDALERLAMADRNWGWTVEMQIKAAKQRVAHEEVPVTYRRRGGGASKVSGTIRGSINAGTKILWLLAKSRFERVLPFAGEAR